MSTDVLTRILEGITVTLKAEPDPDSEFGEWTGCETEPSVTNAKLTITTKRPKSQPIRGNAAAYPYRLLETGTGAGSVASAPPGSNALGLLSRI